MLDRGIDVIIDFKEYHLTDTVDFEIQMNPNFLRKLINDNSLEDYFKINDKISCQNYVLFDE